MFIEDYVKYMKKRTSAIDEYHRLVGICMVSASLSRKTCLHMKNTTYFPNIWGVLVGESSISFKSTCLKFQTECSLLPGLYENPNSVFPGINLAPSDGSPEGLMLHLSENNETYMIRDEISRFWKEIKTRKYQSGVDILYAELFECPSFKVKRLAGKKYILKNIYMTMIVATTPQGLTELTPADIDTGYVPRFLFVVDNSKHKKPRRIAQSGLKEERENKELREELYDIYTMFHRDPIIDITSKALKEYNEWFDDMFHKSQKAIPLMRPFYSRYTAYALKLAIVFSCNRHSHTVDHNDIWMSIDYINRRMKDAETVIDIISSGAMKTRQIDIFELVKNRIQKHVTISHSDLLRSVSKMATAREVKEVVCALIEMGEIDTKYNKKGGVVYIYKGISDDHN